MENIPAKLFVGNGAHTVALHELNNIILLNARKKGALV